MNEINKTYHFEQEKPEAKFKPGDVVLFAFMYGHDTANYDGTPKIGFVQRVEYVPSCQLYLYHLCFMRNDSVFKYTLAYICVDEHLVFDYYDVEAHDKCLTVIKSMKDGGKNGQN